MTSAPAPGVKGWGAGSSLEGNSIPLKGGIVVNFGRMNRIVHVHSADFQVTVEDAQLLKQAKPNAQLVIVKNMNHMLKTVENDSENQQSYYNSDFPLSTSLVKAITEFIRTNG